MFTETLGGSSVNGNDILGITDVSMEITAHHILKNLSMDLYSSIHDCAWELARNGIGACMRSEEEWDPDQAGIEIFLTKKNPLSKNEPALVILDHGRGFTNEDIIRYHRLGADKTRLSSRTERNTGASQKGIGRFAGFCLNRKCWEDDTSTGFYILTRTAAKGPVRLMQVIPDLFEEHRQFPSQFIEEDDPLMTEVGPIFGSFTAIVIPNSMYKNHDEIVKGLEWRIPRKKNLQFSLKIGGKEIIPKDLPSKVTWTGGQIEVYLDVTDDKDPNGGIWFSDARTGLRVAHASKLQRHLPDPFWARKLTGEIIVPNLLTNQDTSRQALTKEFLEGKEWGHMCAMLKLHVKARAEELLGDNVAFGNDQISKDLDEIINLFGKAFGPSTPTDFAPDDSLFSTSNGDRDVVGTKNGGGGQGQSEGGCTTPTNTDRKPRKKSIVKRVSAKYLQIGEKSFVFQRRMLSKHTLAQVDMSGQVMEFNADNYVNMPTRQVARLEHIITQLLEAAAIAESPDFAYNAEAMRIRVGELREQIFTKK